MSRVDVIVPCYKYAHYLRQCVESVLSQSHDDLRVLIIDDYSPDNTEEVAQELVAQDGRVAYSHHESNQGHIATYNEGLEWADGDYVLLLSADDLLTPGALERAVKILNEFPEVTFVFGEEIQFSDGQPLPKPRVPQREFSWLVWSGAEFLSDCCSCGFNPVPTPTAVVRSSILRKIGGYCEELPHSADMELWLRLAVYGAVGKIDANQAYKRRHSANMQYKYANSAIGDLPHRKAAFEVMFRDHGHMIANCYDLERASLFGLAMVGFWAASEAFDRGDLEAFRELLDFAVHLDPEIRSQPCWARLVLKSRIGPQAWRLMRPLFTLLRTPLRFAQSVIR